MKPRRHAPTHRGPQPGRGARGWLPGDHRTVRALLADPRLTPNRLHAFADRAPKDAIQAVHRHAPWLITPQAGDHAWIARTVRTGLARVHRQRHQAAVSCFAGQLLAGLRDRERFDVVDDYALPLSAAALAALIGVDRHDGERLIRVGRELVTFFSQTEITVQGAERMARDVSTIVADAREALDGSAATEGFLAEVRHEAQRLDRPLEDGQLLSLTLPLVTGFVDAANLVGIAVWLLLSHPQEWQRIGSDPCLVPRAVAEALRFGAPVAVVPRFALQSLTIGGRRIPAGTRLQLSLALANRDPARFSNPDEFDIDRSDGPGLAFGHGAHSCVGAPLARSHAAVALGLFARATPHLSLDPDDKIDWAPVDETHLLARLRVRSDAATS